MPYVPEKDRGMLDRATLSEEGLLTLLTPGQLNYILTRFVAEWLGDNPDYARYNAALGVLEAVKQELYRRQIAPYEDEKCEANGDVY